MKGCLAIFVKTPSLSPIKTRLAATIGIPGAEEFYRLSVMAVSSVAKLVKDVVPLWAVAELNAEKHWQDFEVLVQGEGGLGKRLSHIYSRLKKRFEFVILLGADCPQIPVSIIEGAASQLNKGGAKFVIGPCLDGGFYLFGGQKEIPEEYWTRVTYSSSATSEELAHSIKELGHIAYLPTLFDIDTEQDLERLARIQDFELLTQDQQRVILWAKERWRSL